MSDTGWVSPGTVVNDASVGSYDWYYPSHATASDDSGAYFSAGINTTTHYLKATNFGFSIPSGATIDGIEVRIERNDNSADLGAFDNEVKIVKSDGSIGSENKGLTTTADRYPSTDTYQTYGGSSDLWSETWSDTDINDADFGTVLSTQHDGNAVLTSGASVDHIQIKVYYTEGSTPTVGTKYHLPPFKRS